MLEALKLCSIWIWLGQQFRYLREEGWRWTNTNAISSDASSNTNAFPSTANTIPSTWSVGQLHCHW
jgi:hypothetical protein